MSRIDELAVLKTLDPAAGDVDLYCPRALTDLERILATDPTLKTSKGRKKGWRSRRRLGAAIGVVAATTAIAFVVPSLVGGDQAIANWTADPTTLSAEDTARAAATCRTKMVESGARYGGMDADEQAALSAATVAISERRGPWSLVVLTGRSGVNALCIDDRIEPGSRWFMGSSGSVTEYPGRRELQVNSFGTSFLDGRVLSLIDGLAGRDVVGVSYNSRTHGKVKGTVAGGRFVLWLPGKDMEHAIDVGVLLQVTYRDGSTATVKLP
ncbi:hypothetical protein GCM10009554_39990 [Kribbella koreensis]|uniref:Uncharacterized protein n=2 Tax=Kribbella TaxID=182639 RepID=A0ABP6VW63_9ACTN